MTTSSASEPDISFRIQTPMRPQDPLPETEQPEILACLTDRPCWLVPHDSPDPYEGTVDIVRRDSPPQAYKIIQSRHMKSLDHHAPGWGHVLFGIILPRLAEGVYQMPNPDKVEHVAIKRLNKEVVDTALRQGKRENPYKEIYRMQTLGDNVHVLGCLEALQDEEHLYIIMPFCEQESLVELIPWRQGLAEDQARHIFRQILENLMYLRQHGICHRDLSPDNCMVYRGRLVLTDLAMSFRIPPDSPWMTPLGGFGKPAYLPPEVFLNLNFDARACDLWSSVVILFNLLVGEILYKLPHPSDMSFRYFVLARGISHTANNERAVEVLAGLEGAERLALFRIASRSLQLSPEAVQVLDHVLRVSVHDRWTAEDIENSAFVNPNGLPLAH